MAFNPHPFQQQNADLELKISQKNADFEPTLWPQMQT